MSGLALTVVLIWYALCVLSFGFPDGIIVGLFIGPIICGLFPQWFYFVERKLNGKI